MRLSPGETMVQHVERLEAEIERLRLRNAALVEALSCSLCPYNGQATGITVGECQQCGCSHGLFIKTDNLIGN